MACLGEAVFDRARWYVGLVQRRHRWPELKRDWIMRVTQCHITNSRPYPIVTELLKAPR